MDDEFEFATFLQRALSLKDVQFRGPKLNSDKWGGHPQTCPLPLGRKIHFHRPVSSILSNVKSNRCVSFRSLLLVCNKQPSMSVECLIQDNDQDPAVVRTCFSAETCWAVPARPAPWPAWGFPPRRCRSSEQYKDCPAAAWHWLLAAFPHALTGCCHHSSGLWQQLASPP